MSTRISDRCRLFLCRSRGQRREFFSGSDAAATPRSYRCYRRFHQQRRQPCILACPRCGNAAMMVVEKSDMDARQWRRWKLEMSGKVPRSFQSRSCLPRRTCNRRKSEALEGATRFLTYQPTHTSVTFVSITPPRNPSSICTPSASFQCVETSLRYVHSASTFHSRMASDARNRARRSMMEPRQQSSHPQAMASSRRSGTAAFLMRMACATVSPPFPFQRQPGEGVAHRRYRAVARQTPQTTCRSQPSRSRRGPYLVEAAPM